MSYDQCAHELRSLYLDYASGAMTYDEYTRRHAAIRAAYGY